jgi:hypothetical protein
LSLRESGVVARGSGTGKELFLCLQIGVRRVELGVSLVLSPGIPVFVGLDSSGISAFLKGPHQLGSRNPNKPGLEDCSRSHHFTAYLLLQESHKVSPFDRGGYHASRGLANLVSTLSCRLRSIQIVETQVRAISQVAGAFLCRCLSTFMRNSQGRKNSKERLLRYTFQEPWSKGNQESFRRVPRERAETPKSWNSSRCYKEHPYWTNNLKYAR